MFDRSVERAHLSFLLSDLGNSFVFPQLTTDPILPADDYTNREARTDCFESSGVIDDVYRCVCVYGNLACWDGKMYRQLGLTEIKQKGRH